MGSPVDLLSRFFLCLSVSNLSPWREELEESCTDRCCIVAMLAEVSQSSVTRTENASDLSQMTVINLLSHGACGEICLLGCLITQKYPALYLAPIHITFSLFLSLSITSFCLFPSVSLYY